MRGKPAAGHNAIEVEPPRGETTKRMLHSRGLLDTSKRVARGAGGVIFPLLPGRGNLAQELLPHGRLLTYEFEARTRGPRNLGEALAGVLDESEISQMGSSFDLVGRIAVLELPQELKPRKLEIGKALLSWLPVDTVAVKASRTAGDGRVRGLETISGAPCLSTTHRENGLRFRLDLSEVFFNPRLSGERARLADLPTEGDLLIDMFAGVGPISITISRAQRRLRIYAVDSNPAAFGFLEENIRLNGAWNVVALHGDSAVVVPRIVDEHGEVDRIVMNLPATTPEFLSVACAALRRGGLLHYYRLAAKSQAREQIEGELAAEGEFGVVRLLEVESYSPSKSIYVADAVLASKR